MKLQKQCKIYICLYEEQTTSLSHFQSIFTLFLYLTFGCKQFRQYGVIQTLNRYRRNSMLNIKKGTLNRPRQWLSLSNQNQNKDNKNNKNLEPLIFNTTSKSKFANNFVSNMPEKIILKELKPIDLHNRKESRQSKQSNEYKDNLKPLVRTTNSQQSTRNRSQSNRKKTNRLKTFFVHTISEIQTQVDLILDSLKEKNILSSNHMTTYTIKKEDFIQLLYKIVYLQIHQASPIYSENLDNFLYLNIPLNEINKHIKIQNHIHQAKLFLLTQTLSFNRSSQMYQKQLYTVQTQLQKLFTHKKLLQSNLIQLQAKKDYLQKNNDELIKNTQKIAKEYHELCQKNKVEAETRSKLLEQIKTLQQKLTHVLETSQKIFTYAGDQNNNQLVKDASQHYLDVESDIYDYAAYLQTNPLAHKLGYQPYPFDQLTNDIDGKLKRLNKTLIQEQSFSIKDKERFMRDFLMESIDKYRKKDNEQWKMIIFRGKCIQNFIAKMQHLLQNWELKQQYLKNLRNEFAFDSGNLVKQLNNIEDLPLCECCKPKIIPKKANLLFLYQKVENIYKMGNSFY